jgi:hypothetical protein
MTVHPHLTNSFSLKIFRLTPYNSEILVLSRPQVHCFHRSEGEGVPPSGRPTLRLLRSSGQRYFERDFHPLSFMPKKTGTLCECARERFST